jgi:hypothetical protein
MCQSHTQENKRLHTSIAKLSLPLKLEQIPLNNQNVTAPAPQRHINKWLQEHEALP